MKLILSAFVLALCVVTSNAQTVDDGRRIVLTDGNELYAWCLAAQQAYKPNGVDHVDVILEAKPRDLVDGAKCWSYITGVIESIPAGAAFDPAPDVRLSQYIDVVTAYLRDHPNIRQQPAAHLTRVAVEEAFPHRNKKGN